MLLQISLLDIHSSCHSYSCLSLTKGDCRFTWVSTMIDSLNHSRPPKPERTDGQCDRPQKVYKGAFENVYNLTGHARGHSRMYVTCLTMHGDMCISPAYTGHSRICVTFQDAEVKEECGIIKCPWATNSNIVLKKKTHAE